jgi:hypothetical protein
MGRNVKPRFTGIVRENMAAPSLLSLDTVQLYVDRRRERGGRHFLTYFSWLQNFTLRTGQMTALLILCMIEKKVPLYMPR